MQFFKHLIQYQIYFVLESKRELICLINIYQIRKKLSQNKFKSNFKILNSVQIWLIYLYMDGYGKHS